MYINSKSANGGVRRRCALNIILSNSSDLPIYQQIVDQIRDAILRGELTEGTLLPSIRALAKDLRISVITTGRAYDELEREGYVLSVGGKGSFVAPRSEDLLRESRLRMVEEKLAEAVRCAQALGIGREEVGELMEIIYREGAK
jgi:GntR family transcriptional regulator